MRRLHLFEGFVFEMQAAEIQENPDALQKVSVEDFRSKVSGSEESESASSPNPEQQAYYKACKTFAASNVGKKLKVPVYGMVQNPVFKLEGFADVCFSHFDHKGAGVWVKATRIEESRLEDKYYPQVFVAAYVTTDAQYADFDFNPDLYGKKIPLKKSANGYYCYALLHKRIGENLDLKSTPCKFTYDELVSLDPNWRTYFDGLIKIAKM